MNNNTSFWVWFRSFFDEENGASTTRALNWIWLLTFCGCLTFIVIYNAYKTKEAKLPPIDSSYIILTSTFLAAKVGQRIWGEPSSTTITTVTPTEASTITTIPKIPESSSTIITPISETPNK